MRAVETNSYSFSSVSGYTSQAALQVSYKSEAAVIYWSQGFKGHGINLFESSNAVYFVFFGAAAISVAAVVIV